MSAEHDDADMLAAEYVLGTLDEAVARNVPALAARDPQLAAAIAAWERRLGPLAALAPAVEPPTALWDRLAGSIAGTPAGKVAGHARLGRSLVFWRGATTAGFALAAAVAAFALLRPPAPVPVAALVAAQDATAAFVVEQVSPDMLRLVPLEPVHVADGRDLELWALAPGATAPVSLGVLPATGRRLALPRPMAAGTQLLVSLEPRGGSPTGLPTGPVLFGGKLRSVD